MPDALITASDLTLNLAPVVGAYLCLSATGLLRGRGAEGFLSDLHDHPASLHAVGAIAFFVGATVLALHREWTWPAEIVLNLVAAWWVFEGAGMLADPARLRALFARASAARGLRVASTAGVLPGLYLLLVAGLGHTA